MPKSLNIQEVIMVDEINGVSLAGLAAEHEDLSPVVGPRRCRISRPLTAPVAHIGRWGRVWLVDLVAARKKLPLGAIPDATIAHAILEAPWSSEVVHSYSLICVHLRPRPLYLGRPVTQYLEGATHEISLIAINPEVDRLLMLTEPADPGVWLSPPVFAAQIVASGDEAAMARILHAAELVCAGSLSPHPTHVRSWVQLFGDNLLRRAQAPSE